MLYSLEGRGGREYVFIALLKIEERPPELICIWPHYEKVKWLFRRLHSSFVKNFWFNFKTVISDFGYHKSDNSKSHSFTVALSEYCHVKCRSSGQQFYFPSVLCKQLQRCDLDCWILVVHTKSYFCWWHRSPLASREFIFDIFVRGIMFHVSCCPSLKFWMSKLMTICCHMSQFTQSLKKKIHKICRAV